MSGRPPKLPPMGAIMALVLSGMIVGTASATLLYDAAPFVGWVTAIGICGSLFALAKLSARSEPSPSRFVAVLALASLTFAYLLVLGGQSAPRPVNRDALGLARLLIVLLVVLGSAAAVPILLMAASLRRRHDPASRAPALNLDRLWMTLGLGAASFVLGLVLLLVTAEASPPQWRLLAIVIVVLGSPVLLLPFWSYMYQWLLSRWEVPQPPRLLEGLDTLGDRTGFVFDRILCLDAGFGGGRVCEVVSSPGRSTLVLSEWIPRDLTSEQLLAVLAHEAAHVRLHHVWRKLAWGALGGVLAIAAAVVFQLLMGPFVPPSLRFVGVLVVVLPIVILRGLYDTFVVRCHEAEADAFAVDVAGAAALLDALRLLGAGGISHGLVHDRWTTHGTWERRASRIQEAERTGSRGVRRQRHRRSGAGSETAL